METTENLNIAVIGAGVAGIVSAYLLQQRHRVTLFDKNDYIGGHTHTLVVKDETEGELPVDTGFIVFNERTYPNFIRFIEQLEVPSIRSSMSFSYHDVSRGFMYCSNPLFGERRNIIRFSFWKLLLEILRFNRKAAEYLQRDENDRQTLGDFLKTHGFSANFTRWFIIPMGAAIWSTPDVDMLDFPARTFIRFFDNHGLLTVSGQPQWYTIQGGSHEYVKRFLATFKGTVIKGRKVEAVQRSEAGVRLRAGGEWHEFDRVVIAAHGDEALAMLEDPSPDEDRLLSAWRYTDNDVFLHTDASLLPPNPKIWSSWNYVQSETALASSQLTMSYYMNQLQSWVKNRDYLVTLNPRQPIAPDRVVEKLAYSHPMYTFDAVDTQKELSSLNGKRQTYFCGSYFRYGFHEDAVWSAVNVGHQFGVSL